MLIVNTPTDNRVQGFGKATLGARGLQVPCTCEPTQRNTAEHENKYCDSQNTRTPTGTQVKHKEQNSG